MFDKYKGVPRENVNLKYDYVLLSAFQDGEFIIHVQLHIKEFEETGLDKNKLYVTITLGKIKVEDEIMTRLPDTSKKDQTNQIPSSSVITVADLITNVNHIYGDFFKYIQTEFYYNCKAIEVIRSVNNNSEKVITIYRAVQSDIKDSRVRNGDWVDIVIEYAVEHGRRMFDNGFRIIENKVPTKYLCGNEDSIN